MPLIDFTDEEVKVILDYFCITLDISREQGKLPYTSVENEPAEWFGNDPEVARQFQSIIKKVRPHVKPCVVECKVVDPPYVPDVNSEGD